MHTGRQISTMHTTHNVVCILLSSTSSTPLMLAHTVCIRRRVASTTSRSTPTLEQSSGLRDKNYQPLVNIQCHRNTLWTHVVRPPSVISILPIDSIDEPCSSSTRVCIQESYSSQEYNAYQSTIRSMDTHAYTCTMHSVVCIILCILLQSTSYAHTTVEQYVRARIQKQRQLPSLKHKYYQI